MGEKLTKLGAGFVQTYSDQ